MLDINNKVSSHLCGELAICHLSKYAAYIGFVSCEHTRRRHATKSLVSVYFLIYSGNAIARI